MKGAYDIQGDRRLSANWQVTGFAAFKPRPLTLARSAQDGYA